MTTSNSVSLTIDSIGTLRSPFTDKFGIPRQANLIRSAYAEILLHAPYNNPDAWIGLDNFSHIWITFNFHLNQSEKWRPMIRPPRLGGNKKIGVFASRSPFRPNGLGQSLVELREIVVEKNQAKLIINCPDLIDGTPIFDIKPYIHYADSSDRSVCAYADKEPERSLKVNSSKVFQDNLAALQNEYSKNLLTLIEEVIAYDPRPAYKKNSLDDKLYKLRLYDLDISFTIQNDTALLTDIEKC